MGVSLQKMVQNENALLRNTSMFWLGFLSISSAFQTNKAILSSLKLMLQKPKIAGGINRGRRSSLVKAKRKLMVQITKDIPIERNTVVNEY